jgi:uncharacterized membrane protein
MEFTRPNQPTSVPPRARPVNDVTAPASSLPSVTGATAVDSEGRPDTLPVHSHNPAEPVAQSPQVSQLATPPQTAPPTEQKTDEQPKKDDKSKKHEKPKKLEKPEKIKANVQQSRAHGTGGAVFAAVVIILGLGAMFTYAYLRSQNIAVF